MAAASPARHGGRDRLDLGLLGVGGLDALAQHQILRLRAEPVQKLDLL